MANGLALLGILNVLCGRVEPAFCTCIPAPALPGDGEFRGQPVDRRSRTAPAAVSGCPSW